MELSLITNDPACARTADESGIDRILIDLERHGKAERQAGKGLFLSTHEESDVARVRAAVNRATVMVRVDPIHPGSPRQVPAVIDAGADVVMLPYFHSLQDVRTFLQLVAGRAKACLLVETREAASLLADLCRLPEVAEMHIGLNDLSLSCGKPFLFDLIADGTTDRLCATLRGSQLPFGFAGVGRLSQKNLPVDPELILAAQVTQGATRFWLGRTFRDVSATDMPHEVQQLRAAMARWSQALDFEVAQMREQLRLQICAVGQRRAA